MALLTEPSGTDLYQFIHASLRKAAIQNVINQSEAGLRASRVNVYLSLVRFDVAAGETALMSVNTRVGSRKTGANVVYDGLSFI